MSEHSVSHWIDDVREGDDDAVGALWERYFEQLVRHARRRMAGTPRKMADEEDVALSAFHSFVNAARSGRLSELADREGLWRLLLRMTARKAIDRARHERRDKRGGGRVQGESILMHGDGEKEQGIGQIVGEAPTPEFTAMLSEEYERVLAQLGDDDLKRIAIGRMEGYSNAELAQELDCSERTIERRLKLIRRIWEEPQDGE